MGGSCGLCWRGVRKVRAHDVRQQRAMARAASRKTRRQSFARGSRVSQVSGRGITDATHSCTGAGGTAIRRCPSRARRSRASRTACWR